MPVIVMHGHEKKFYGTVKVGERGQVVIPNEAREELNIKAGEKLLVFGKGGHGLMMVKADEIQKFASKLLGLVEKEK
ncbi:MAG: AbrB/MazE/SpoVT family DNA-binding domain-containing protein [Candidatus Diapherotrites archaeon]